jgi:hypothetical protein
MSDHGVFQVLDDVSAASSGSSEAGLPALLLAWFDGARGAVLRRCPGERSLSAGLGTGVLLATEFCGASATSAVACVPHDPVSPVWPVAMLWGLTLANFDRLLLLIPASKRHLLTIVPRLVISALLWFLIAQPLTLRIFQPRVSAQVAITQERAQRWHARLGNRLLHVPRLGYGQYYHLYQTWPPSRRDSTARWHPESTDKSRPCRPSKCPAQPGSLCRAVLLVTG